MEDKDQLRAKTIGSQIESLLKQSGISIIGLASAISMSVNHVRTIKQGKASSISTKTAGKIADFFGIEIGDLFSSEPIKLNNLEELATLQAFYKENENNPKFFEARKGENSIAYFLKNTLVPSGYFREQREVYQVREYAKKEFNKDFDSKEISRQLNRMVESGELEKEDKTGNKSIYVYKNK